MDAGSRPRRDRLELGWRGEDLAACFLALAGLEVLERNLRVRHLEIDLLAREADCLVAVEVRLRRSDRFGDAAASVTPAKRQRLRTAVLAERQRRGWRGPCRVDLLALDWAAGRQRLVLEHYRGI